MSPWPCFLLYYTGSLNGPMVKTSFVPPGIKQDMTMTGQITFLALLILGTDCVLKMRHSYYGFKGLFCVK